MVMTVQMSIEISNPKLADRILNFLLSEETTAYPAQVLSQRVKADTAEVKEHITAINKLKARWIYEIPQPDGKDSFYIIGNCKTQIKEHLKKGGFQQLQEADSKIGEYRWWIVQSAVRKQKTALNYKRIIVALLALILLALAYSFWAGA